MLSGIGDAAELVVFGIPVVVDLPAVGKNLQDHLDITIMHEASDRTPIRVAPSFIPRALAGALSYVFQRRGFRTRHVAESGGLVQRQPSQRPTTPTFPLPPHHLQAQRPPTTLHPGPH